MSDVTRDIRLGVRQLIRSPGFSTAAIASLALGIGLNTALFGIVNAILLRNTPIREPDRLVEIYSSATKDFPQLTTSYPDYLAIREAPALEDAAAHAFVRAILSGDTPQLVTGEAVTASYFPLLGIQPGLGRAIREDEQQTPGSAPVVVISHGLWQRRFGGQSDVVGQTIRLSGLTYTVIGVAPASFPGTLPGISTDVWVPVTMVEGLESFGIQWSTDEDPGATRLERRGTRWLFVKGRLAAGRSLEEARAQIDTIYARLQEEYPKTNDKTTASVWPAAGIRFHPMVDGYVETASAILLTAVGLVLLIACANVANLLLARATARQRELAIRAALGAGRGRLVRQLLSEGLLLAAAGGLLGVVIGHWTLAALVRLGADLLPQPFSFDFSLDGRVLAFAVGVSAVTALLFGLAPAISASRPDLAQALKQGLDGSGAGRQRVSLRDTLVVGQLALSVVLLVSGALLGRGLLAARGTDLGFDPTPISALSFNLQMNGYDVDRAVAFQDRAIERLRALPGVAAVSTASRLPFAPDINMESIKVPGHHGPDDDGTPIDAVTVGADYFGVIGVPIVGGRAFTPDDIAQERKVAIVNETMARRFWPDGNALGRLIYPEGYDHPGREIVGIARDHKVRSIGEDPRPYVHFPTARSRWVNLVVRTTTPAVAALPTLRAALSALEPDLVFTEDVSATEVAEFSMAATSIGASLIGAFGMLAVLLAAVGLYGVIAYSVSLRTREVGVRMALGASRGQVLRMVLVRGGRLALLGMLVGAAIAAAASRVLSSLLYGISGYDPLAYSLVAGLIALIAVAANLSPALSAARIDPLRALRTE
jgi:putative ABC transport system permease protein